VVSVFKFFSLKEVQSEDVSTSFWMLTLIFSLDDGGKCYALVASRNLRAELNFPLMSSE
jgi:hypothetical protein